MFVKINESKSILAVVLALAAMGGPLFGMAIIGITAPAYMWYLNDLSNLTLAFLLVVVGGSATGLALSPSFFLGAVCGYLVTGSGAYLTSSLGLAWASGLGLYLGRLFDINFLEALLKQKKGWWDTYQRVANTSGPILPITIALLRLSPHMPFALTNLVCARLPIPLIKIWFFSFCGLLPRTFLAVYIGTTFKDWMSILNYERSPWELFFSSVFFAMIFYLIRHIVKRFESKKNI